MSEHRLELRASPGGFRLLDRRADVTPVLRSLPVERAIAMIPTLLPVCAAAQRIAAERSVESARDDAAPADRERARERELLREQAMASAWRLLVDWPRLARRPLAAASVRPLQALDDRSLGVALRKLLPGLAVAATVDDLLAWSTESDCVGASVAALALGVEGSEAAADTSLLHGAKVISEARPRLFAEGSCNGACVPRGAAYVGALAMNRHPLVQGVAARRDLPTPAKLVLAMLLDTLAIADRLADGVSRCDAYPTGTASGMGSASTARGPLFHGIVLDGRDRVNHWRILAPTDWHVAPEGVLQRLLRAYRASPELIVGIVDPCAPWRVTREREEAVAHA